MNYPQSKDRYVRQPTGRTLTQTDGDVEILSALQRHGVLNTWQLTQLCPHYKSIETLQDRLHNLYHEHLYRYGHVIDRPKGQRRNQKARSTRIWYQATPEGRELLKDRGLYQEYAVHNAPPLEHQIFCSTMSFSLEYETRKVPGLRFLPQYEANKSADIAMEIELDGKTTRLVPDGYVALEYEGRRMYIFKEEDRATEGLTNKTKSQRKNARDNIRQYHVAIGKGKHKSHFDVRSDAILLFTTVDQRRLDSVLKIAADTKAGECPYIFGTARPECEFLETMPDVIPVYDILWERPGGSPVRIFDLLIG